MKEKKAKTNRVKTRNATTGEYKKEKINISGTFIKKKPNTKNNIRRRRRVAEGRGKHAWRVDRKIINNCDDHGACSLNYLTKRLARNGCKERNKTANQQYSKTP